MSQARKKRKINILVAADHAAYKGKIAGVGRYLLNVLPRIDQERFNIELIILREAASMERALVGTGVQFRSLKRRKFDPLTLRCFTKAIKRQEIDVLHLHQYASSNFGRLAGKIMAVPTVVHIHGPDLPYPTYQWLADRLLAPCTYDCIAVSESVKREVSRRRAIKSNKIVTLHNGIPLERFQPLSVAKGDAIKRQWGIADDSPVVGTITRLHEVKGNRYLMEAAAQILSVFPQVHIVILGDGPLLDELEELAEKLGISQNVIFAGYWDNAAEALSVFDIKVIASTSEGHPQSLLEAMVMGKAIVATKVGGIPEAISDGVNGLLVPPRDPDALADRIIHLLRNTQERDRLGREARKQSGRYSMDAHVSRLESIYEKAFLNHEADTQAS